MRSVIMTSISFVCFIIVCITMLDIQKSGAYSNEIQEGLQHSIHNAIMANQRVDLSMRDSKELEINSLRMLAQELHQGGVNIAYYACDSKGLLDIGLEKRYMHFNQKLDVLNIRKRGIYERAVEKG